MQAGPGLTAAVALGAVLILIVLAARVARLRGWRVVPGSAGPQLRMRATLAIDARRRLHLVDTDAGALLILTGGGSDALLPWPAASAAPAGQMGIPP